jgi:hypothetical protein
MILKIFKSINDLKSLGFSVSDLETQFAAGKKSRQQESE